MKFINGAAKYKHKIHETHTFLQNIFNNGAILPQIVISYRLYA